MSPFRSICLLGLLLLGMPQVSRSQIRDNDSSVIALAMQCAVSSGYQASGYEDYSRRLAKTLSLLSSDQQARVFGYLPTPSGIRAGNGPTAAPSDGGSSTSPTGSGQGNPGGETEPPVTAGPGDTSDPTPESGTETPTNLPSGGDSDASTGNPTDGETETPVIGNGGTPEVGESGDSPTEDSSEDLGFLVNLVQDLNDIIDGTSDAVTPVIAGTTGIDPGTVTDPVTALTGQLASGFSGGSSSDSSRNIRNTTSGATSSSASAAALLSWVKKFLGL